MRFLIGLMYMFGVLSAGDGFPVNHPENRPLVIILMGPPGAGKGTHANPLSRQLDLPHISTGDLFRENIRTQTSLGQKAKSYMDQGNLVPDELVVEMLFARVGGADCRHGYILDGFPRTVTQAKALDERIRKENHVLVLNFNLDDATIIERVTGRIACKQCGRPYHKKYDPPKQAMSCDSCSGPLIQREDDQEQIVRKRLEVYRAQTEPLIAYYSEQKETLRHIDSAQGKEQVFHDVLDALTVSVALKL